MTVTTKIEKSEDTQSKRAPIDAFFTRALVRDASMRFPTAVDLASAFADAVRE